MTQKDKGKKKEDAQELYMKGFEQKQIAQMIGVTEATVSRWQKEGSWKERRAALSLTRPELVNKLLLTIDTLIEQVNASNDPTAIAGLADKLSKLSATVSKLDKQTTVVDAIEVFTYFAKWLEARAKTNPDITVDLLKQINKYQEMYIVESMSQ